MIAETPMKRSFRRRAGLVLLSAGWLVSVAALFVSLTESLAADDCDEHCFSVKPDEHRVIARINNQIIYFRVIKPSLCGFNVCTKTYMHTEGMDFGTDETHYCLFDWQEVSMPIVDCEPDANVSAVAEPSAEEEDGELMGQTDCWRDCNPEL